MKKNTKATLLAVRAVGAVYGRRIWKTVALIALCIAAIAVALCIWLVSLSAWWWILAIVVGMGISIAAVVLFVFRMVLNSIDPVKTTQQKETVRVFADKLQFVKELTETPKFIILFKLIRSVAAPSSEKYLETIFETKKLHSDFKAVVALFN